MSDLDADLYGDLYGNDEGDYNEGQDEQDPLATTDAAGDSRSAEDHSKPSPPTGESSSLNGQQQQQQQYVVPQTQTQTPTQKALVPANANAPVPIQSYTSQPPQQQQQQQPQQIPTYEQPQPTDYREQLQAPRGGDSGGYQSIPVNERSVRPSEMKDEGKMFIGGLNWDTTDDGLREYFTQFGKVDACTIMRDAAGRSRCFAFLTFEDPASVNAVMVREHFLDGKIIDPKRAIPRQEHQRATKLFIGGLAGSVTSESMREFFSQFGKVIDSTVMLDRETGRSKGFGFVSFEDTNVQPFLGFGNLEIDGKLIDVKLAQPRYQRDNFSEDAAGADFQGGVSAGAGAMGVGGNAARFGGQAGAGGVGGFNPAAGATGAPTAGGTPFDPQALAALYTRMFQMTSGGGMNPGMMGVGGMNPMMGGMNPAMMGGMGGAGMRPGMGMMGMGMGRGGAPGMGMGGAGGQGGMAPNVPRGPRGGGGGQGGMGGASVGPQRSQRGQHNFHPYAR